MILDDSEGKNESLLNNKPIVHKHNTDQTGFSISSDYLTKLEESFNFSLKVAITIIGLGIIFVIIGQMNRFNNPFENIFSFIAIFGLLLSILGFLILIRDLQLSNLSKIKYQLKVEPRGIAVFQENVSLTEPISFFPFNTIIGSEIVSVSKFIKKRVIPTISSLKFTELSSGLSGVLLNIKIDNDIMEPKQQQIFFDLPLGYSLFIVEDSEKFLKMIKSKQIKN